MKWREIYEKYEVAKVGPLYCSIQGSGGYKEPGHPDHEPETFNWLVAPDDEDKNYRRAYADGNSSTMDGAKFDVEVALHRIIDKMREDMA